MDNSFSRWDRLSGQYDFIQRETLLDYTEAYGALYSALKLALDTQTSPLRVLDLGCGTGQASRTVLKVAADRKTHFTFIDGSNAMLQLARQAFLDHEAEFHCMPFESEELWGKLPDGSFHLVVAAYALHHLPAQAHMKLYQRISRVLKPSGLVAILDIHRPTAFAKELADKAYCTLRSESFEAAVRAGDALLNDAAPSTRNFDQPIRIQDHLTWCYQAELEATVAWQGLESCVLLARRSLLNGEVSATSRLMSARAEQAPSLFPSVLDTIGLTPLVRLDRFCVEAEIEGNILAKLDSFNPGLSKKDRIAIAMLESAIRDNRLAPDQPVVELTSGNTGTGLAIACAVMQHPFIAVMSAGNSSERAQMMAALGAEVVIVPQTPDSRPGQVSGEDLALVEQHTQTLVRCRGAFRADQFLLPENITAHEFGTGVELWEQSGGDIQAFVDFAGTGGTFTGVARALKARRAGIRCYAVEPAGAPVLAGALVTDSRHRIQGGGYAIPLTLFDPRVCDGFISVQDEEAITATRMLARSEGILAGFSSGANLAAALQLLRTQHRGETIACLICDSGVKYLSTDLFPKA